MSNKIITIFFAGVIGLSAACAQNEPQNVTAEPMYNKLGDATGCRQADGRITPVTAAFDRQNPCRQPDEGCEFGGFYDQSQNWVCRPERGGDNDQPTGRGQNQGN